MRRVLLFTLILLIASCRSITPPVAVHDPMRLQIEDTLYLGTNRPAPQPPVSDEEWHRFLTEVVTPLFPDGLTAWNGYGQWRENAQSPSESESSHVLLLIHDDSPRSDAAIRAVIDAYKKRFDQRSVMQVRSVVYVRF